MGGNCGFQAFVPKPDFENEHYLQDELNTLTRRLGLSDMEVVWKPDETKAVSGEVKDGTVYVYDRAPEKAIETLRHEVIDYLVCKAIEPYIQTLNAFTKMFNDNAYRQKEGVIDRISKLLVP